MPKYVISDAARSDVRGIVQYTKKQRSSEQAVRYAAGLQGCFRMLAQSPGIGRACETISPGLRRFEHGKHVVFYRIEIRRIRIVRVLHQRMLPDKSRFEA